MKVCNIGKLYLATTKEDMQSLHILKYIARNPSGAKINNNYEIFEIMAGLMEVCMDFYVLHVIL